jgi:hypothetical protein
MAAKTPLDDQYTSKMKEQLEAMLRHFRGLHVHPNNLWYKSCTHSLPYAGIPMDSGDILFLA